VTEEKLLLTALCFFKTSNEPARNIQLRILIAALVAFVLVCPDGGCTDQGQARVLNPPKRLS
jgi:hypothetical protein